MDIQQHEHETYDFDRNAFAVATERGQKVYYPQINEILIDIDSEEQYLEFSRRITELVRDERIPYGFSITRIEPSKSGLPHRHIHVEMFQNDGKPVVLGEWQRICLQFALGSDRIKELLRTYRVLAGISKPTVLFK